MPKYCCLLQIFYFVFFILIEKWLKIRTTCKDPQAKKSAAKRLSQKHSRMARVGFEPRAYRSQSWRSKQSTTLTTLAITQLFLPHISFLYKIVSLPLGELNSEPILY